MSKSDKVQYMVAKAEVITDDMQSWILFNMKITQLIKEGWECIGGVACVSTGATSWMLLQAMIKKGG